MRNLSIVSRLLLGLALTGLAACGRSSEALNSQGYRAMRFGAHEDAHYFFKYAQDLMKEEGAPAGEEHPELQRTIVGQLGLGLFEEPAGSFNRVRATIAGRRAQFTPADYDFLARQLLDEARRPVQARALLDFARLEFPDDGSLAELVERMPALPDGVAESDPALFLDLEHEIAEPVKASSDDAEDESDDPGRLTEDPRAPQPEEPALDEAGSEMMNSGPPG